MRFAPLEIGDIFFMKPLEHELYAYRVCIEVFDTPSIPCYEHRQVPCPFKRVLRAGLEPMLSSAWDAMRRANSDSLTTLANAHVILNHLQCSTS